MSVAAKMEGVTSFHSFQENCFLTSQDMLSQDRPCFVGTVFLTHLKQHSTCVIFSFAFSLPAITPWSVVQRSLGTANLIFFTEWKAESHFCFQAVFYTYSKG